MSDPGVEPLEILEILELETPHYHPHLDFLTTCLFGHPEENCWFRNKLWKWLRWQCCVKRMLNLRPSVWKSARRWLASRCHSPSPSTSGPTSPSPWTPGGWKKKFWQPERRRRPPQRWGATQGGEKSIWGRNSTLQLLRKHSSVTNVTASSNRKTAWRSTSEKPTRMWNQPHHRLIACDSSQAVRQPGLLPPSGMSPGRKSGMRRGSQSLPLNHPAISGWIWRSFVNDATGSSSALCVVLWRSFATTAVHTTWSAKNRNTRNQYQCDKILTRSGLCSGYEVAAGTFVCANILEYIYIYISSSTLSLSTLSVGQLMVGVMSFHKIYDLIGWNWIIFLNILINI